MTRKQSLLSVSALALGLLLFIACGSSGDQPLPGATYSGALQVSEEGRNATAKGGQIEFTLTQDGTGIASLGYSLNDYVCTIHNVVIQGGGWTSKIESAKPVPIEKGSFKSKLGDISVNGKFSSGTKANGTMKILKEETPAGGPSHACDYGTWYWSATVR